jgi:hypothetical protein
MKKQLIIIVCIMVCLLPLKSQNQQNTTENYWNYHDLIRKAEIAFYLNNDIDSCLYYYNQVFNTYSFNYVHDLVNAAQIACFSKKEYKPFVYKGLYYGLKSSHLKQNPILMEIIHEIEDFEKTIEYKTIRQNYLSGIDFNYLSWIYDFGIEDQIKKTEPDYDIYTLNFINELILKIKQNGFPSNNKIGIEDSTIFSEIGEPNLDLIQRLKKHHDYFWKKEVTPNETFTIIPNTKQNPSEEEPIQVSFGESSQISFGDNNVITFSFTETSPAGYYFKTDDEILSNHFIMVLLYHRGCSFSELKDIMLEEILKGNLHPREFGFIYDRQCEVAMEIWQPMRENCPQLIKEDGVFRIGNILNFGKFEEISQDKVNALRAKYNIVPLEVDKMKRNLEKDYGFKLFWGFWDCL